MESLFLLLFLAVVVERLIEYLSQYVAIPKPVKLIASAALGILLSINFQADLFLLLHLPSQIPYVGMVVTGVVVGAGSNFVNSLMVVALRLKERAAAA